MEHSSHWCCAGDGEADLPIYVCTKGLCHLPIYRKRFPGRYLVTGSGSATHGLVWGSRCCMLPPWHSGLNAQESDGEVLGFVTNDHGGGIYGPGEVLGSGAKTRERVTVKSSLPTCHLLTALPPFQGNVARPTSTPHEIPSPTSGQRDLYIHCLQVALAGRYKWGNGMAVVPPTTRSRDRSFMEASTGSGEPAPVGRIVDGRSGGWPVPRPPVGEWKGWPPTHA